MATVTPAAGDIVYEDDLRAIDFSPGENVLKGDVVTLVDGLKCATTVVGPYGVALEDCLTTETKAFAIAPSTIYLVAAEAGFTAFTRVVASTTGVGADDGMVEDWNAEDLDCIIGSALEAKTDGLIGKVRLGFW